MFIDKATIIVRGGDGGSGCMSFRREKFIPRGGPNGGDGGNGGNVFFRANTRLKTLLDFSRRQRFEAAHGKAGSGYNRFGLAGEDLILDVPLGTTIFHKDTLLADLTEPGQMFHVVKGGRGGRGNWHFKSSIRQAPRIAEKGEPAEEIEVTLRLRTIADIGLIGLPNAGKSTLLSRLTRAHPKIANYPFTTLYPNLGVTVHRDREIIFADIPGLIEGSHKGKGLGHEFLQHVERTRVLIHVVDPMGYAGKDPADNIKIINEELKKYSKLLAKKAQIITLNKMDLTDADVVLKTLKKNFRRQKVFAVSGVSGQGLTELLDEAAVYLDQLPPEAVPSPKEKPAYIRLEPDFWVERHNNSFVVRGKKVESLVAMTPMNLPEAVERTQNIMKKIGVEKALISHGAERGDSIKIAGVQFTFEPDEP